MKITETDNYIKITDLKCFDIHQTFDCGQCFRFDFINNDTVCGIAFNKYLKIHQPKKGEIHIYSTLNEFESIWRRFLALDVDYLKIKKTLSNDNVLKEASKYADGIRILRQDSFEALISFIISQNNNIPRIKKIIENLCQKYGNPIKTCDGIKYSFPSPKVLADAGEKELFELKTGFRAKYINDAAQKIASNEILLKNISKLSTKEATEELCKIKGVGPKVAACTLLFGFDKGDCFPVDVWMKRVLEEYYPNGLNIDMLGKNAGIAQQYLFYYRRYIK